MQMNNKKGDLLTNASFEVIIGVSVVILIVVLVTKLFAPVYSEADKIAESYFEQLKENIALADNSKSASFYILDNGDDDLDFYLVYFGNALQLSYGEGVLYKTLGVGSRDFSSSKKSGNNIICVCYWQDERTLCKYCANLDLPVIRGMKGLGGSWIINESNNIVIIKSGGKYVFSIR